METDMSPRNWRDRIEARLAEKDTASQELDRPDGEAVPSDLVHNQRSIPLAGGPKPGPTEPLFKSPRSAPLPLKSEKAYLSGEHLSALVPPTLTPPSPPLAREMSDSRHDLRAWVLVSFAVLGFVFGFGYRIAAPSSSIRHPLPKVQTGTPEVQTQEVTKPATPVTAPGTGTPAMTKAQADAAAERNRLAQEQDAKRTEAMVRQIEARMETAPSLGPVPITPASTLRGAPLPKVPWGGLTGRNAPLPVFSSPAGTITAPSVSPGPGLNSQRSGPELD
jgi:hypothetical protein